MNAAATYRRRKQRQITITGSVECVVTFDYEAEEKDELTIKVGDVIKNVEMEEGGWWYGELNGKTGRFPDNFVYVVNRKKNDKRENNEYPEKEAAVKYQQRPSVRDLIRTFKDLPYFGIEARERAVVTHSYYAENEDELNLKEGEVVTILEKKHQNFGWWKGEIHGKVGVFPDNFVEIIETSPSTLPTSPLLQLPTLAITNQKIAPELPYIKLEADIHKHENSEPISSEKHVKRNDHKVTERAVVRNSYYAENEDELDLKMGEVVTILEKELKDVGWWKGEIHGKVGVFPDNFVEIVDEPIPEKPPEPPSTTTHCQEIAIELPYKESIAETHISGNSSALAEPVNSEKHVKEKDDQGKFKEELSRKDNHAVLFDVIASKLNRETTALGIHLGLTQDDIDQIRQDNHSSHEQNFQIIWQWFIRSAKRTDHIEEMKKNLAEIERNDVIKILDEFDVKEFEYKCKFNGDELLTEKDCLATAQKIGNGVFKLLRFFGKDQHALERIGSNCHGDFWEQALRMLTEWRKSTYPNCTRNKLCSGLTYMKREDIIRFLEEQKWDKT